MNRMTVYRRLKKLGITKDTADLKLVDIAFDPVKAYRLLFEVTDLFKRYGIKSVTQLESILEVLK